MNPVVVVATHDRKWITCKNIDSLLLQSAKPQIVLVVSDREEKNYYESLYPEIIVTRHPNQPLGAKWQHGVDEAKRLLPDPLIILGSDDLLATSFIHNAYVLTRKYDFLGISGWFIYHKNELTEVRYHRSYPLGTRAYNLKYLQKIGFHVFDTAANRKLDDKAWIDAKKRARYFIVEHPSKYHLEIISIKGDWTQMNPAEALLNARTIKVVRKFGASSKEMFNKLMNHVQDLLP